MEAFVAKMEEPFNEYIDDIENHNLHRNGKFR